MKRVHAFLHVLGPAGVLGVGVLLFCIPFYLSTLRPVEDEIRTQHLAAERLRARSPYQPVSSGDRAEELHRFYSLFPATGKLPDQLDRLYSSAQQAGLELPQGEYRLERHGDGLTLYRITLPLHGTYPQIRAFVGATMQNMPTASLDALQFESKKIGDPMLDAQMRLTLYFQPGNEGEIP